MLDRIRTGIWRLRAEPFVVRPAWSGAWWWIPFYALVVVWTYRDLWHQHGVPTGFGWDVVDLHGPDLEFMARELREGRFSLWNPWDKGGYAVYADPIVCRYYPFSWPFVAWGAAFGASWWLIQLEVLGHHVAMAVCMHAFLHSRGVSTRAAMIGGVGLISSAPLLVHKASIIVWPLTWVPLVWLAIDAAIARPSWRRGAGLAAAFTLVATAGSPPGAFYATLLIAPYVVWRIATVRLAWRQIAACAAVAAVLAAAGVAVTAIPTRTLVALGSRGRWAHGDAFPLSLSLGGRGVVHGAFVHAAGFVEMYGGAAIVLLAACAQVLPRRDRGAPWLFAAIAVTGFVLVIGAYTPVLPWLVHHVPGFALMRIPGRYKLVSAWSLAAAASFGADGLASGLVARPARWRVAAVAGLALGASLLAVVICGTSQHRPAWWSIAAMAVPCALVGGALYVPRLRPAMISALVVAVLLDAPSFTHTPARPPAADPRRLHLHDDEILARLDGVRDRFRLFDEYVLGERVGQRRAVREVRGYPAIDVLTHDRYYDVFEYVKRDPEILTDLNVRWLLQAPHFRFGRTGSLLPLLDAYSRADGAFVAHGGGLFEARHPAPLVAWYGAVRMVTDPRQVLPAMRGPEVFHRESGERRRAVIEPEAVAQVPAIAELAAAAPGSAEGTLVSYEPDEIALTVDAPRAGLVVLNELAFPGWAVEVDGKPAIAVRANYLLRAVYVAPGHHAIRWRFAPPWIRPLLAGCLAALAVMLAAAILPRRPWRRRSAGSRAPAAVAGVMAPAAALPRATSR